MTLPTKILFAVIFVIAGSAYANADVTAKSSEAVNFEAAAPSRGPASLGDSQAALSIQEEIADNKTEGGSCQINCHLAITYNSKTALAHIDLDKIK